MNGITDERKTAYRCPLCGNLLPHLAGLPPFDAPCCECGAYLWCRLRESAEGVVLEVVPGRAPESWEVKRVVDSLGRHGALDRLTIDLSHLAVINSSFLAALVGMKKGLQAFGCVLLLCGLRPIVREIFDRLRLDGFFQIVESEDHVAVCA
jgi:anti-anti-sigma regulatory factor